MMDIGGYILETATAPDNEAGKLDSRREKWKLNPSTSETVLETGLCFFSESPSSVYKLHPQI